MFTKEQFPAGTIFVYVDGGYNEHIYLCESRGETDSFGTGTLYIKSYIVCPAADTTIKVGQEFSLEVKRIKQICYTPPKE
jgi:hypothetical protein